MRLIFATLIWLLDLVLKIAVGQCVVVFVWLCFRLTFEFSFGIGWLVAGGVVGASIIGFFDGCDIFLAGWARRIATAR